jgi:soluble lytic murein transglycosylase-like protein
MLAAFMLKGVVLSMLFGLLVAPARGAGLRCADALALASRMPGDAGAAALVERACREAGAAVGAPAGAALVRSPVPRGTPAPSPMAYGAVMRAHPAVDRWVSTFLGPARGKFDAWLAAGEPYRALIEEELQAQGVPVELRYLALVESGFNPAARSRAGAVGLFQIMPATARQLGLRVDGRVDERTDPRASTRAGVAYLRRMAERFGSWHLAMAAYNCGPGCVAKAIEKTGSSDYWTLCAAGALPRETRDYVPKIIAAARIGQSRAKPLLPVRR